MAGLRTMIISACRQASAPALPAFMAQSRPASIEKSDLGGYDYQFVAKYICSICTKVLRDAHLTVCCGQHFCASCLSHSLGTQQGRRICPHCRQDDFQFVPNKAIICKVNELKICCTNHREGCGWVGELGGLKSHLDSDKGCGYVEVTCTNEGCQERMSRKDLQTHLQEKCYYRPYECEHCGHKDTYTAITTSCIGHYSECPEYPLDCPNRCGVTGIKRRAMPDHHSSCPLKLLDCPFKDAGCTEKIARKNMADHMTANQHKHMLLTFQTLQQSNQQLRQELVNTKQELQRTKQEFCATKQELQQCNEQRKRQFSQQRETDLRDLWLLKDNMRKEIHSLEKSIRRNTNVPECTAQSLSHFRSILQVSLDEIGDKITFQVTDFTQLRKEKKAWHSPPFSIGDQNRVRLAVYPSGVGRGQGSHVSVSLILIQVVNEDDVELVYMWLQYNISVAAVVEHRSAAKTLELCTIRWGDDDHLQLAQPPPHIPQCSVHFPFPSPGEVLRSEELFLEIEQANSLLMYDSMTLELKLLEHQHH